MGRHVAVSIGIQGRIFIQREKRDSMCDEELKPDRWQLLLKASREVLDAADIRTTPEAGVVRWVCPWGELVKLREAVERFADEAERLKVTEGTQT
jgi:hypothetical protein